MIIIAFIIVINATLELRNTQYIRSSFEKNVFQNMHLEPIESITAAPRMRAMNLFIDTISQVFKLKHG
jgi:hypothetical protein